MGKAKYSFSVSHSVSLSAAGKTISKLAFVLKFKVEEFRFFLAQCETVPTALEDLVRSGTVQQPCAPMRECVCVWPRPRTLARVCQ